MKRLLSVALMGSTFACYSYAPVGEAAVPETGKEVRAHLSPARDFPVGELTVRDVTEVEGTVFRATSDTLALWTEWLHSQLGNRFGTNGNVYYVPRSQVPRLEVRRLHPAKTIVALGIVVGAGLSVFTFAADIGGGGIGDRPPPPAADRVGLPIGVGVSR
jgi:hypothetical protein